jgi:hypothetical protein
LFITEFVFESAFNQIDGGSGKVVTKRNRFFYVINAGRRYFSPHGMGLSVTIINQMP